MTQQPPDEQAPQDPPQGSEDPAAESSGDEQEPKVIVIGPNGMAVTGGSQGDGDDEDEPHITELVEQPAKVMRIGGMIRQLLEEVKAAPLDEASRTRLAGIYASSIKELETGLAPELVEELERLSLPFTSETPSEAELRIAQAQLVGWLEGLFHGIQTAIYAQQMAARAQLEQMRRALPPGLAQAMKEGEPPSSPQADPGDHRSGGMYL
jgi:Protein of unknown function (DUF2587)